MKKIYESTTIYAALVFIGFYNYYIYHSFFDIEIASFPTTGELLLSFLPLTFPIVILIAFFVAFYFISLFSWGIAFRSHDRYQFTNDANEVEKNDFLFKLHNSPKMIWKSIKDGKWKSPLTYLNLLVFTFQFLLSILIVLFLFFYFILFLGKLQGHDRFFESNAGIVFILGLIWIYTFDFIIDRFFSQNSSAKIVNRVSLIFMFSIGMLTIKNMEKANKIKEGIPEYNVVFEYQNKPIRTNNNLVFVGLTEKYLFLRDLKQETNKIYLLEKIDQLELNKYK